MADTNKKTFNNSLTKRTKALMIVLVCLFALLIVGLFLYTMLGKRGIGDPNVVAEVGGEKIYLQEYKERLFAASGGIGSPSKPEFFDDAIKKPVLDELIEDRIVAKELEKKNITISESELVQEARNIFKDYDTKDITSQKSYKNYVRLKVGKEKLKNNATNWKEGYALYCYSDRAYQGDIKDRVAIDAMRSKQDAYAKDYCTKMKERLETGKSNYQAELTKLQNDPEIGLAIWKPLYRSFGEEFKKETFPEDFHSPFDVRSKVSSLSTEKNKYYFLVLQSKYQIDRTSDKAENRDGMYAVVYIKDGQNSGTDDLERWLSGKRGEYKVKAYLERVKI